MLIYLYRSLIILTQIKQNFITPANAIFDYVDMVEKVLNEAELQSDDEIDQIKSSCSKLIDQYEGTYQIFNTVDRSS